MFKSALVLALTSFTAVLAQNLSALVLNGTSVGATEVHEAVNMYVSRPPVPVHWNTAVVYLTDVYGIQLLENRLLADSFARAGYFTVAPDMFNGTPAPTDINNSSYNSTAFMQLHAPAATDPIVAAAIRYLRTSLGFKKVAVTGYCFGGRYSFRSLAKGYGNGTAADLAFAAHPASWTAAELSAITGPMSVAHGDLDTLNNATQRSTMEAVLMNTTLPYQVDLYGGSPHGFAVRANLSDPKQLFSKQSAFLQAVRWFDYWS